MKFVIVGETATFHCSDRFGNIITLYESSCHSVKKNNKTSLLMTLKNRAKSQIWCYMPVLKNTLDEWESSKHRALRSVYQINAEKVN